MVINGSDLLVAAPIKDMHKKKLKLHGVSHGLGEAGYDIRLKQKVEFRRDRSGKPYVVVEDGTQWFHTPGHFAIASAIEEFQMPDNLMGIVHDKSTWARRGLSVFNTVIEPGWKGFLTLELVYHNWETLTLPEGAGIAQVVFHKVSEAAAYKGKYQNQEDRPTAAIHA